MGQNVFPPLLFVDFLKMNHDGFLILCDDGNDTWGQDDPSLLTQRPSAVFDLDFLAELTIHDLIFPFDSNTEMLLLNCDRKILAACPLWYGNGDVYFAQLLPPGIWKS